MANLTEVAEWQEGIRQLERSDVADAGLNGDGVANVQARQLANRTAFLKERQDALVEAAEIQSAEDMDGDVKRDAIIDVRERHVEVIGEGEEAQEVVTWPQRRWSVGDLERFVKAPVLWDIPATTTSAPPSELIALPPGTGLPEGAIIDGLELTAPMDDEDLGGGAGALGALPMSGKIAFLLNVGMPVDANFALAGVYIYDALVPLAAFTVSSTGALIDMTMTPIDAEFAGGLLLVEVDLDDNELYVSTASDKRFLVSNADLKNAAIVLVAQGQLNAGVSQATLSVSVNPADLDEFELADGFAWYGLQSAHFPAGTKPGSLLEVVTGGVVEGALLGDGDIIVALDIDPPRYILIPDNDAALADLVAEIEALSERADEIDDAQEGLLADISGLQLFWVQRTISDPPPVMSTGWASKINRVTSGPSQEGFKVLVPTAFTTRDIVIYNAHATWNLALEPETGSINLLSVKGGSIAIPPRGRVVLRYLDNSANNVLVYGDFVQSTAPSAYTTNDDAVTFSNATANLTVDASVEWLRVNVSGSENDLTVVPDLTTMINAKRSGFIDVFVSTGTSLTLRLGTKVVRSVGSSSRSILVAWHGNDAGFYTQIINADGELGSATFNSADGTLEIAPRSEPFTVIKSTAGNFDTFELTVPSSQFMRNNGRGGSLDIFFTHGVDDLTLAVTGFGSFTGSVPTALPANSILRVIYPGSLPNGTGVSGLYAVVIS